MQDRLAMIDKEIFDPKAIQYLSGKAAESGDIRQALDLCLTVFKKARTEQQQSIIQLPHVIAVMKKLAAGSNIAERIGKASFNMQLVLWCIVKKTQSSQSCKLSEVKGSFHKFLPIRLIITSKLCVLMKTYLMTFARNLISCNGANY